MAVDPIERKVGAVRVVRLLGGACLGPFFQVDARGVEHLPDASAFVLLAKHQRWEDIPLLGLSVPKPLYYVAKAELFRWAPARWMLSSLGGIPLNRDRPLESRRSLRRIIEHLRGGEGVVIFPEGTYYPGCMGPPRAGLVRMVLSRTSPPFVPVGIRYRKGIRTGVEIRFGPPMRPESSREVRPFLDRVMSEIARLSGL
jgi:1-acyl-sn-glycerol-3-phosphate acyltransferase